MEYEINKLKKKETRFLLINFMEKTFALEEYEDTNRIIPFRKGRLIKKKDYRDYPENYSFVPIVPRTVAGIES